MESLQSLCGVSAESLQSPCSISVESLQYLLKVSVEFLESLCEVAIGHTLVKMSTVNLAGRLSTVSSCCTIQYSEISQDSFDPLRMSTVRARRTIGYHETRRTIEYPEFSQCDQYQEISHDSFDPLQMSTVRSRKTIEYCEILQDDLLL